MSAAAWLGSLAVLNCEVSSAKSFMSHLMFAVKSLMYTRKMRGPGIEHCGMPADIEPHFHALPFKAVRCFLLSRKLWRRDSTFPEKPQLRSI